MDELYSDLNNYEDVNIVDELRNENKNLKYKVDEYSIAMEKLQKDFDKLSSEFKKLEMNYSSLLKTARAEVERKTHTINSLNAEKDMLVLNALKSGNKTLRNIRRNMTVANKNTNITKNTNNKNDESDSSKTNKNNSREFMERTKPNNSSSERIEEKNSPSVDTNRNSKIEDVSKVVTKVIESVPSCSNRNDAKENAPHYTDGYEGSVSAQSGSIKHRRKSILPLSTQEEKFSTDEEFDTDYVSRDHSKEYSSRNDYGCKRYDRDTKKYCEPSTAERYYGSRESTRDPRKSRFSRNYDGDKYKSQEKFEYNQRSNRHSPVRSHRKSRGDYQESQPSQRSEYRKRVLESPPQDKYYNYKRKTHEHPMNIDRNHPPIEYGYKRHYQSEHQSNTKMPSDYEEPSYKRVRTNLFHRNVEEDYNKHENTKSYHSHTEEVKERYDHMDTKDNPVFDNAHPGLIYCMSPDFLHADLQIKPDHQIREIKSTAVTQLDDPRITSDKYVIEIESNNEKSNICSKIGKNVVMQPVDRVKWRIPRMQVPELLVQKPALSHRNDINEELIKEVYVDTDIESAVTNISLESGEIYSESVPHCMTREMKHKLGHKNDINEELIKEVYMDTDIGNPVRNISLESGKIYSESMPHCMTQEMKLKDVEYESGREKTFKMAQDLITKLNDPPKELSANYRIPKLKHCDKVPNLTNTVGDPHPPNPKTQDSYKKRPDEIKTISPNTQPHILENENNRQMNYTISGRQVVEGDLELSDDASDNTESHSQIPFNPKRCKNDNTLKNIVDKNQLTIPNKHSSIFDIQQVDPIIGTDTNKSKHSNICDVGKDTINKNKNWLPIIDIQLHEIEMTEGFNLNEQKQFVDKNIKKNDTESTLVYTKQPEIEAKGADVEHTKDDAQVAEKQKTNPSKHPLDIKQSKCEKDKSIKSVKDHTPCLINEPDKKHVEETKDRANSSKVKEKKKDDKNRKSTDNNSDPSFHKDIQQSVKETSKISESKTQKNKKSNQKQDQSMVDIQINIEEIKATNEANESQIIDKKDKTGHRHKHPDNDDKSDKCKEIKKSEQNQKSNKKIEATNKDKNKGNDNTPKSKAKKSKPKETQESLKDPKSVEESAKKGEKEKDNSKDIKSKFAYLFGDSNSLITPEELGINSGQVETIVQPSTSYMTIFEDAQDAIDLTEMPAVKLQEPNIIATEETPSCMTKMDSSPKRNADICNVGVISGNDGEVNHDPSVVVTVNENMNIVPLVDETDVVKTVIISSGVQPTDTLENDHIPETRHENVIKVVNTESNNIVVPKSQNLALKALATSTPYKELRVLPSETKEPCVDSMHMSEQSDTNTMDSQTDVDTDAPDVRIFVRRRRKVIKKPTA